MQKSRAELLFNTNTNEEIKKYSTLKTCFQKLQKQEDNFNKTIKKSLPQISQITQSFPNETKSNLNKYYVDFNTKMSELENARLSKLINKLNDQIIPGITHYSTKIKDYKTNPHHLLQGKEQNGIQNPQQIGEKELLLFEIDRNEYNKTLFLHYIHSELAWHASALQNLSNLYKQITDIDPCQNIQQFRDEHHLNVGDIKEFYDPDELNRSKRQNLGNEDYRNDFNGNKSSQILKNDDIQMQEQNQK